MKEPDAIIPPDAIDSPQNNKKVFKATLVLGLGVGLIYLAFLKPGIWGIDGTEMFHVANSLVTKGDFTVPEGAGIIGQDGQYYSIRYPLFPIFATPFVALGLLLSNILHVPPRYGASVCALLLPIFLTAISTSLVALLSLRLGSSKKGAYLAALSYAFGTAALVYAHQFFSEPLLSLLTTLSIYLAIGKNYKEHAIACILCGLAVTTKPAGVVIGPVLCLYFFCNKYPWRTTIGPLLGTAWGVMLYMAYNYMRFGDIFTSGQNGSRFSFEIVGFLERLTGLIFSPSAGGGLVWYCTPVVLCVIGFHKLFKTKPIEALLIIGIFCGYWLLHSCWEFGGWSWGPRFLIPTLPGLFAVIGLIDRKWWNWLIGLSAIGLFWNAPTLFSYYQRYYAEAADAGYLYSRVLKLWGNPADMPLFNAWGACFRQLGDALTTNVNDVLGNVGAPPEKGQLAKSDLLRIIAVWWWVLPAAGIPMWIGFLIAVLAIAVGVWKLRQGWLLLQ